jgi:hypothetical protein
MRGNSSPRITSPRLPIATPRSRSSSSDVQHPSMFIIPIFIIAIFIVPILIIPILIIPIFIESEIAVGCGLGWSAAAAAGLSLRRLDPTALPSGANSSAGVRPGLWMTAELQRLDGDALTATGIILLPSRAPSHLRTFATSHLRTFAPSHLRTFAPTHSRTHALTPSRTFAVSHSRPDWMQRNPRPRRRVPTTRHPPEGGTKIAPGPSPRSPGRPRTCTTRCAPG